MRTASLLFPFSQNIVKSKKWVCKGGVCDIGPCPGVLPSDNATFGVARNEKAGIFGSFGLIQSVTWR